MSQGKAASSLHTLSPAIRTLALHSTGHRHVSSQQQRCSNRDHVFLTAFEVCDRRAHGIPSLPQPLNFCNRKARPDLRRLHRLLSQASPRQGQAQHTGYYSLLHATVPDRPGTGRRPVLAPMQECSSASHRRVDVAFRCVHSSRRALGPRPGGHTHPHPQHTHSLSSVDGARE